MSTSKKMAWFAWIIVSSFYAYQYILRVMPGIMMHDITNQFDIEADLYGQFAGIYYLGYALLQLPIGIMMDRLGPRKVMTGCIMLTIIGLMPLIFADHCIYLMLGRAFIGVGSSAAILGVFNIVRMSFPEKKFSRMLSFSVTIGLLGAMYGGYPVSLINQHLGYHTTVELFSIMGTFLACITYIIVPDITPQPHAPILAEIKTILTNHKVIVLCFCAGLMVGPLEGFADVWGPAFFKQVYGINTDMANSFPSIIFLGMCLGGPILSILAEKTGHYMSIIIASGILMLLAFIALLVGKFTISSISFGLFIVGICCAYQILAIYKASTYVPAPIAGLTTAVANVIIMSFGYLFHSSIGFVVNYCGGTQTAQALLYGICIIPLTLALAVIGLFYITRQVATTSDFPKSAPLIGE